MITDLDNEQWTHIDRDSFNSITAAISELNSARIEIQKALDDAHDEVLSKWLENPDLIDNMLDMRIAPGLNQDIIDSMIHIIINYVQANV